MVVVRTSLTEQPPPQHVDTHSLNLQIVSEPRLRGHPDAGQALSMSPGVLALSSWDSRAADPLRAEAKLVTNLSGKN